MGKSLTRKILEKHLVIGEYIPGNEIGIKIDQTLTQDATGTMAYLQFEAMGLKLFADRRHRARVLTTVKIPEGIDDLRVRQGLLNGAGIEIGRGIGPLRGKIWRIGLLGNSSTEENVLICLKELEKQLAREGYKVEPGTGVTAAIKALNK